MAMLAEPRRRQRICANPRGNFFMEDENNKGKVLLHKMGWKDGDGLGQQNQGMSEPIRPKVQSSAKGLGYDAKIDPWVEHNKSFAEILENLNSGVVEKEQNGPDNSSRKKKLKLENLSQTSKSRIHYKKFVKSKDLSSISNQDWNCIFGKPKGSTAENNSSPIETSEVVKDAETESNTINRGSMQDYFKAKLAEKLSKAAEYGEEPAQLETLTPTNPKKSKKRKMKL